LNQHRALFLLFEYSFPKTGIHLSGSCASYRVEVGDFARRANHLIACPAPFAKIFSFSSAANHFTVHRHPAPARGAYRDRHGRWARDAMDAGMSKDE
jgi:hypothetical protein